MSDLAHQWTDRQIQLLGDEIDRLYAKLKMELALKLDELLGDFDRQSKEWSAAVARGEVSQLEYDEWLDDIACDTKRMGEVASELAKNATRANRSALAVLSSSIVALYIGNANLSAYEFESGEGLSLDKVFLASESQVLPESILKRIPRVGPDGRKDYAWNRRKIMAIIMSAVLTGATLPEIRSRVARVYDMDMRAVKRTVVTVATAVESVGKLDTYASVLASGVPIEKQWVAVMDNRTRMTHRELDGQAVPLDQPFIIGSTGDSIRYPGDPEASPSEIYNCRCELNIRVAGSIDSDARLARLPENLTYDEWKSGKRASEQ